MGLRGVKPEAIQKRLKALFFGPAGVGKTMAAIQFPKPYLVDTEKGAENDEYVKALKKSDGVIFQTTDFDEMLAEVMALLSEKHEYRTFVLDPLTTVYNDLLDKAADKVGTDFGRHYGEANKQMKHLVGLILRLDMNVIITCHAKNLYGDNLTVLGQSFDGWKKLDYLFDLVIELQRRGKERKGVVKKTRISSFPDGHVFDFSYDAIAELYGRDVLERKAVAVKLATVDDVSEITKLTELLKVEKPTIDKWLAKASAGSWAEMSQTDIQKCIKHLRKKVEVA